MSAHEGVAAARLTIVWYSLVAKMIRVTRHVGDVGYVCGLVASVDKMEPRASYGSDGVRTSNRD
jgi:hypothetical protein